MYTEILIAGMGDSCSTKLDLIGQIGIKSFLTTYRISKGLSIFELVLSE
jgi:hypothetical protein